MATLPVKRLMMLAALVCLPLVLFGGTPRSVRISFLPPPLEGTISLGIYDGSGKLVRVLNRESDLEEFEIGDDALSTTWDGKDDSDQPLPAGKYHARGYVVGDLAIEGVGFFFNDWVTTERPERITKICAIAADGDGVIVAARTTDASSTTLICDRHGEIVATREDAPLRDCLEEQAPPGTTGPIASASGRDHTRWRLEPAAGDATLVEVKQFSPANELLRILKVPANDPQPRAIAAAPDTERIFLLEKSPREQRLRSLSLAGTTTGTEHSISDWTVDFEKKITAHKDFRIESGKPVITGGETPPGVVAIKLRANPLQKDARPTVELSVGPESDGSILKTADGLPLQSISETKHLTRVVLAPNAENSIDVFQDDEAVVEQFRVSGLDQMMAFDCGEIELK